MSSNRKVHEAASIHESIINHILPDDFISYLKSLLGLHKRNNGAQTSLHSVFGSYRKVLDSSNRAVRIISAMNERLGGDFPADLAYAEKTYSELCQAVNTAIENFDMFTQYKYKNLHDVFGRINREINQTIHGVISADLPEHAHSSCEESIAKTHHQGKNILRGIAPLNLVDPMFDNFSPEGCKTIHDIIRFMHVTSVRHLARTGAGNSRPVSEHLSPALR